MSVYPQKGPWAFVYDGDSICFLITSRNRAMEYHFIQREGGSSTDRSMLVETSDGPIGSNAYLFTLRIGPGVYTKEQWSAKENSAFPTSRTTLLCRTLKIF